MKISEIIKDKYKLRIPPTVYYNLLADVQEIEEEQEPMVEIDLYSVIKQKYIEREVLDKIRAEIESKYNKCDICEFVEDYDYEENDISEYRPIGDIADILQIIDKYKGESEDNGNVD